MMKVIGLTGNSGSGKNEVCNILSELGGFTIDCDIIAHKNMAKDGVAYKEIIESFGDEILDANKNIDRKILGGIVFSDKEKLALLNKITHKHITDVVNNLIDEIKQKPNEYKCIVVNAALLVEAKLDKMVDSVWVVTASVETRVKRLIKRDDISKERVLARLKNQISNDELIKIADVVINNDGDIDDLKKAVYKEFDE